MNETDTILEEDLELQQGYTCTATHSQCASVSLPVRLSPYDVLGRVQTICCGDPTVTLRPLPASSSGCGCECEVVITQNICMQIPITYGAAAESGSVFVRCRRDTECPK